MLSLRVNPISNPKETAKYYFSKDNYYYTGELSTQWVGLGAQKLNLSGEVKVDSIESLLAGELPNGEIIGLKSKSGEIKHRCGYDLTFSAPKSVSYLALVSGHKEFIEAHQNAVKKVLTIIEKEAAGARKSGKDGIEYEKTGNLCFAAILHDTSREQDPQLHIHALLMNMTERLDGKWRALASDLSRHHGTMEWIMDNQIFLGMVYRAELAMDLKKMDLEIEHTGDPHGLFEIKHFDKALLTALSKRRKQIEEEAKGMHSDSLKAYDRATKATRNQKKSTDPETLRQKWKAESEALGVNPARYFEQLKQITRESRTSSGTVGQPQQGDCVKEAIAHLAEKKLAFSYQDIVLTSLHFSLGEQGIDSLIQQIDGRIAAKQLIALDDEDKRFTTKELVDKERQLIEKIAYFPGQKKAISRDLSKASQLTENEAIQKGVLEALYTKTGIVRITQQSTRSHELLKTLIDYGKDAKTVKVLSPTTIVAFYTNQETRKVPQTVWQWLMAVGKSDVAQTVAGFNHHHANDHKLPFFESKKEREILIVDESQRLSPDDLNKLLSIADKRCAKVILLEKTQGVSGFKSDIPGLLDKANVKTIQINDKPKLTAHINLVEAREKETRIQRAAQEYVSLSGLMREKTQVLAISKLEAGELNAAIREKLKTQGEITQEERHIPTLSPVYLTQAEKKLAKSYQKEWLLIQNTRQGNKQFSVVSVNEKENRLMVRDEMGAVSSLVASTINQTSMVYEKTALAVGVGDKLLATANRSFEGLKVGTPYEVTALTRYGVKIKQGRKTIHLITEPNKPLPLTHAYAKTVFSHDFKSAERTIITLPAYALRKNTYALVSESTQKELTIITDDVEKAKRYAEKNGQKISAISLALESASQLHGLEVINSETSQSLLGKLNQAVALLTNEKPIKTDSEKALQFAIAHLSEREAVFKETELLSVAIQKAIGQVGVDELYTALREVVASGKLIQASNKGLTTQEAVNFEKQIISTVKQGINAVSPLLPIGAAEEKLNNTSLTKGQRQACQLITTTSDRFITIQGYAGTGKTTMTKTAIDTIEYAKSMVPGGFDLIAVAPTHQAVKEMKALGIQAQTLKSFLIEQEQLPNLTEKSIVFLDEFSMVSNRDYARLVSHIDEAKARGVFLGDISQHQSIEAGKPSKILLQEGSIRVAYMDDIVRQQVAGYKQAVETLVKGDTDKALSQLRALPLHGIERKDAACSYNTLKTSVVEASNEPGKLSDSIEGTALTMAVGDYLSRTQSCRDNTVVIIHENRQREIANGMIREALMTESTIGRENKPFSRLLSTDYTTAELYYTETYQDCLSKNEPHYLKKDYQYYRIMGVDSESKVVTLQDTKGNKTIFMPEKETQDWKIELFKQLPGQVSVGEKIHFKKSDKSLGRFANERVSVTEVSDNSFTVKDSGGVAHVLQKDDMKDCHWDYSYTATSYSIQGSSSPFVIGVADTHNNKVSHLRSFYIMISRGSLHAMLYTDNYEKLQRQIRVVRDKTSALESLNRISPTIKVRPAENKRTDEKQSSTPSEPAMKPHYDAKEVVDKLSKQAQKVIESLLGEPNPSLSSKEEHRYGKNGDLCFYLQGDKQGTWVNCATSEGGNLLHLIQKTLGLDLKSSLDYAAKVVLTKVVSSGTTMQDQPNKIDLSASQIKQGFEKISSQVNLEIPENKTQAIEQSKSLQRTEMEIY